MGAELLHHEKRRYDDGMILEMKLWQLSNPAPGSRHTLKYSLFYGSDGLRLVGYDNERGKGDHRHRNGVEERYVFVSFRQLVADFLADVEAIRGSL
jgi:hypothetical protein